jgi:hypothetical protein
MKNFMSKLSLIVLSGCAMLEANVWKCPNDPNDYSTREEAQAVCHDKVYYPRESSYSEEDGADPGLESEPQYKSPRQIVRCKNCAWQ